MTEIWLNYIYLGGVVSKFELYTLVLVLQR